MAQKTYIPRKGQDADFANVTASGTLAVTGNTTLSGTLAVTGGIAGGAANVTDATVSVTAASHAGKVIVFSRAAGVTATLPAATGTGNIYRFVIGTTATSNANIIKVANATDVMNGSINIQQDTDADGDVKVWRADAGDDTMTFAGAATTGGIVGGYIQCIDYKSGFWSCQAFTQSGGGSEATPFSATVA
jgi:hypothetical protein